MMPDLEASAPSRSPPAPRAAAEGTPQLPAAPGGAVVVMGVAGCGKSSLADSVGHALGWPVIEGDDFHSAQNKALMHAGIALTDADRLGWLDALADELRQHRAGVLLSCSALKRKYRDRLRRSGAGLRFVFLDIDEASAQARVKARAGEHFFHPDLVRSQFEALEPPTGEPGVLRLDASLSPSALCEAALVWLTQDRSTLPDQPKEDSL